MPLIIVHKRPRINISEVNMLNLDLISTANYTHVGIEDGKVVSYILGCLFVILATCPCVPVMRLCAFM